jgi:hypothetical protein
MYVTKLSCTCRKRIKGRKKEETKQNKRNKSWIKERKEKTIK